MENIDRCFICHNTLHFYSSRYSCCDQQKHACFRCKLQKCPLCKLIKWKQIREKPCKVCHKDIKYKEGLIETNCQQNYCVRCISVTYLPHYFSGQIPIIIEMRCGHYMQKQTIQKFLTNFCINCGNKILQNKDYELQNQMKLCQFCFKCQNKKYQKLLIGCMDCGSAIKVKKTSEKAEIVLLCSTCLEAQTNIESIISLDVMKSRSLISALKTQESRCKIQPQYSEVQQISQSCSNPLIVSRFSAFDINQSEDESSNKFINNKMTKMLSKNSIEVHVENLKLHINDHDPLVKIRCNLCGCLFNIKNTFKLNTYSQDRTCKICYTQTSLKISQIGFSNSNAASRRYQEQDKHTSLPKRNNILYTSKNTRINYQPITNTNPSYVNSNNNSNANSQVRVNNFLKKQQDWMTSLKVDLCQICNINRSMITRHDKLKVCTGCYTKKV